MKNSMEVEDWSKYYKCKTKAINLNPLAPQWPFRLVIIGPSGKGKTNFMIDLIMKHLWYEKIYILAKDLEEDLYVFLKDFFKKCKEKLGSEAVEAQFFNELEDLPDINSLDKNIQTLFIFDDFVLENHQDAIEEYYLRGRKKNASMMYLTQNYFDTPINIRKNSDYFVLFDVEDKKELRSIADTHSNRISFQQFIKFYREILNSPYDFMLIDKRTQYLPLHIRKNWNGLMVADVE